MRVPSIGVSLTCLVTAASCGETLSLPSPSLLASSFERDEGGVVPTAPIELAFSLPLDPLSVGPGSVFVVRGVPDAALLADLDRSPIDPAHRERLAPGRVELDGATVRFQPLRPLAPRALHTVVVTTAVRGGAPPVRVPRPITVPFTTADAITGEATWSLIDPPDGAIEVVRNLRSLVVTVSRPVANIDDGSLTLASDQGPVPTRVEPAACERCVRLLLLGPLGARLLYRLVVAPSILDSAGRPAFPLAPPPAFTSGATFRRQPPAIGGLVLAASSGCLVTRFATAVPATARLCLAGRCVGEPDRTMLHELSIEAPPEESAAAQLFARDESTAPEARLEVAAPRVSSRPLVITEVLANPRGPVPDQQFVEIENLGSTAVSTAGLELHDEMGSDALPEALVPPGGRAIIVPAGWMPGRDGDAAPPLDAQVLRIGDRSLGGNGIRQSGEALGLFEADGRPLSRFSTYGIKVSDGQSVSRVAACDVAASYRPTPSGTASPGGP